MVILKKMMSDTSKKSMKLGEGGRFEKGKHEMMEKGMGENKIEAKKKKMKRKRG